MIFTHKAVCFCAESDNDVAQRAVIHVHTSFPYDLSGINVKCVSLLDVVVEQSSEQVVRGCDGMEITGKMQIQILHRNDLGITAAGSAALDAEAWSERRLS